MVPLDPAVVDSDVPAPATEPPVMVRPSLDGPLSDDHTDIAPSPSEATASTAPPATAGGGDDAPVMRRDPAADPEVGAGPPGPAPSVGARRHVVVSGQSFWSISVDLARARTGDRAPDLAEIARIWQQLIDRNAGILVDPGNPDLLHRGQVLDLGGLT
jgi:hypothetical protein